MYFDFVSPKFCQILDMAEEDILRDPSLAFSVTHPDDNESLIAANRYATETGESFHWEGRFIVNEQLVWVEISSEPSRLPNGDILWSGIIKDISERKASEEALLKSSKEWSFAMDFFEDAIYLIDLDDKIVRANRTFYQMTGLTPELAIGSDITSILHPEGEEIPCPVCKARKERRDEVIIMEPGHPDNPTGRPIQVTVQIIRDSDDSPLGVLMGIRDLTKIREAEEEKARLQRELHQAQKMDALGKLTGGIAHDFNNILGIIMGNIELARHQIKDKEMSELSKYLDNIQNSSERARDLVAQMMLFSRTDQGESHLMTLMPVINSDIKMLRAILPSSIEIVLNGQDELPKVMMDPVKLQQILMNLCLNAKDAMNGVGQLSIQLGIGQGDRRECSTCHQIIEGDWIELSVTDTGSGINADTLKHIFEPFYTTKEVGKGTGMGLAVVNTLVESLDGHIIVQSKEGEGTTFRLLFPPSDQMDAIEDDNDSSNVTDIEKGDRQSILVVDDEPDLSQLLSEVLEIYGYQPTTVNSSIEALKLFSANPDAFELVITDQTMPQLTGIEMANQIREIRPEMPIILSTGYSDSIGQKEAEEKGIHFLKKPVVTDDLTGLVAKLLHRR
ncbi:MAG: ATP-binding protein [Gammaproteobacteria bacterium]|nr:ATP-binding protein [Gammaproteobacteria bacterium]